MKKVFIVLATITLLCLSGMAQATTVSQSGTFSGVDYNNFKNDGLGNHAYVIDRTASNTFYWSAGSPVSITGTVDVRGLIAGSFLEIGLVDKQQADMSLDTYGQSGYMFNNSAFATFYPLANNFARLADTNSLTSDKLLNTGATKGVFDFTLDILSNGTMGLTIHGASDSSTTYTYGHRNWWDGNPIWTGGELANGSYLISQLWIDTGNTTSSVSAKYNVTASSPAAVPEASTLIGFGSALVMAGPGMVGWLRRRRA